MLKTFFTAIAAVVLASAPAYASLSINGLTINGLTINGVTANSGSLQAARLALPDGTVLMFR